MSIEYISNTNETKLVDSNGNEAEVNESGQLKVVLDGKVSADNSTATPLLSGAIFQGISGETLDYAMVFITIYSDVASATDGLCTEVSSDGITWRDGDCYTIAAGIEKTFSFQPAKRFIRVRYTNGGTDQTIFDMQTVFKKTNSKPSSHRIQDSIVTDDDAELVKSVLTGEDTSNPGQFLNIKSTDGGNLRVTVDQVETTTNSLKTITYSHAELHGGDHFVTRQYETLAKNGVRDILIITPDTTRWAHFTMAAESSSSVVVAEFFEGATVSANGTLDGGFNRNRNSVKTNTTLIYDNPTITTPGTSLYSAYIGSGKGIGGGSRDTEEIMLKQNTIYLLRLTEQNIVATTVTWTLDWYEHTNK